jgi:hypothetical protein
MVIVPVASLSLASSVAAATLERPSAAERIEAKTNFMFEKAKRRPSLGQLAGGFGDATGQAQNGKQNCPR